MGHGKRRWASGTIYRFPEVYTVADIFFLQRGQENSVHSSEYEWNILQLF
jgi:hypothetical protein